MVMSGLVDLGMITSFWRILSVDAEANHLSEWRVYHKARAAPLIFGSVEGQEQGKAGGCVVGVFGEKRCQRIEGPD
jgi:hypothetical protein